MNFFKVDNAIILAAGFGSRFVPITYELPKGLVPVRGEVLLERQIKQLKEKGINEIYIVVGYLKEKFEYLIDKYNVKLIYNPDYAVKNNISSLFYARNYLKNSYILVADNWINENIFNATEEKSWYCCVYKKGLTSEWCVKTDGNGRIINVTIGGNDSWVMYGPVFLSLAFSENFVKTIEDYYRKPGTENYMWENVFIDEINSFDLYINRQDGDNVYEFESLEELREFDPEYNDNLSNKHLRLIESIFKIKENSITNFTYQKAGMTNKSFTFTVNNETYIFRLPGEGTDKLINRKHEWDSYNAVKPLNISDEVIFYDENTGNKISKFYAGARNTDALNPDDIRDTVDIIRKIHKSELRVAHSFDIEKEITYYMTLCNERKAIRFNDDSETYEKMKILFLLVKNLKAKQVQIGRAHV
jgi:CTP:phosphocholine cytidylyltransferase-like protein